MICHIFCGSFWADKYLITQHLYRTIFSSRQQIATSLAIHCFRSQSSSNQINLSTIQWFFKSFIQLRNFNFNQSILLRYASLSFCSIVICTHLLIYRRINWRSSSKLDISFSFKQVELPLDKRVIIRIQICCNEWSCFINMDTVSTEMLLPKRREKSNPINWVYEFWNILLFNTHLQQNMILSFFTLWELWRISVFLQLKSKFFSCCRYWHTSAVETEWEQYIIPTKSLVPSIKVTFRHWECMT